MKKSITPMIISKLVLFLSLAVMTSTSLIYANDNNNPDTLIRTTSQDILEIIRSDTSGDNQEIREQVEARVMPLADFTGMTAFAVGRAWRKATPDEKLALTKEFRLLLARTYLSALTVYKIAKLTYTPARYSDDKKAAIVRVNVSTSTQANNKFIPVDFYLKKTENNDWKVYDIAVEGISFMTNHRNQFAPIITDQGIKGLIKQLNERNNNASTSN